MKNNVKCKKRKEKLLKTISKKYEIIFFFGGTKSYKTGKNKEF